MMPQLLDYDSYSQWKRMGEKDLAQRARGKARYMIRDCERRDLDISLREELDDLLERRRCDIMVCRR